MEGLSKNPGSRRVLMGGYEDAAFATGSAVMDLLS